MVCGHMKIKATKILSNEDKMALLHGKSYSGMTLAEFYESPAHTAMYRQNAKDLNITLFAAWRLRLVLKACATCNNNKRDREYNKRKLALYESLTKDDLPNWDE